jgi:predicted enzyme related to lactoylglutathione lyase/ferritin-like metal-binding protein YciE/predicted ester cyclase
MASQNAFLANWLKGAYGMELGLAPMLEQQVTRLDDDPELRKNLTTHLEQTRRHANLLRERLQRMGEDVSTIRPIDPVTSAIGHANGGKPDTTRQTELLDYVAESFEVASYRGLQSLAEILGDQETSRICQQILDDELAASDALSTRLPSANGHNGHNGAQATAVQTNEALAREVFTALNDQDLGRFDKLVAPEYRADLPGGTGTVDWKENRAWLAGFFKAFPNLHYQLNRIAASGDSAFVEWNATGTHSGPFAMLEGGTMPATDKRVMFDGISVLRFRGDKLIHTRIIPDTLNLMRQLGAMQGAQRAAPPFSGVGRSIVHIEIPAADRRLTASFYNELFGWEYEHMDESMSYTTFTGGNLGGGFPDVNEMNPAGEVLFYVESDDIESDLRRVESLGGDTVVPRTEIPGYGYFAIVSDPTGNPFGLYYTEQPG